MGDSLRIAHELPGTCAVYRRAATLGRCMARTILHRRRHAHAASAFMSSVTLHTALVGDAAARHGLLFLHGIFGRGRNWAPVARSFVQSHPDWRARLADLRHHGDSPRPGPPHSVEACARDVVALLHDEPAPAVVIGHSFGGKVALQAAALDPSLVSQVWVIDSTPARKSPSGSAWQMLEAVERLPASFASRQAAIDALVGSGVAPAVAAWMSANLAFGDGHYRWKLDFGMMRALIADFFRSDLWDVIEAPPPEVAIHVVKATGSSTLDDDAVARLTVAARAHPQVHLHQLAGGHWLNTDNPDGLLALFAAHAARR
jgi:pimeloyl-ACP methyl ester carboxylesterase